MLTFLAVNLFIFFAWWLTFTTARIEHPLSETAVYAGLLFAAQIVLGELLLGVLGLLYESWLIALNLGIGLALIVWVVMRHRAGLAGLVRESTAGLVSGVRETVDWSIAVLFALLIFLTVWLVTAAYFLPPRGVDDLVYHLPPLYEYVQSHRISLLPLELRDQFAFPFNGEFLFLWPLVFFRDDTFIDAVQFVVALYGAGVIYALTRRFGVARNLALFVGLLFIFTPVVLGQAGSNYVDLTVAVCHLTLLYAVVRYYQTGMLCHLLLAGIATGFGMGVKYNFLVAVVAAQPIIYLRFWQDRNPALAIGRYVIYAACSLPLSIYWFVRNFIETGYLLFPYRITGAGLRVAPGSFLDKMVWTGPPTTKVITEFIENPISFLLYFIQDPGLGSFHGGFGMIFWGLCIPALAYCGYRSIRAALDREFFLLFFWGQVLLIFLFFFYQGWVPGLETNQRYVLVGVGFGLLALGQVLQILRRELPGSVSVIRSLSIAAAVLAVVHMAGYPAPTYQIRQAVEDLAEERRTSEYKYFEQSPWDLPSLSRTWAPLDYLTRSGPGWDVYVAMRWDVFWLAPTFGSRLQNRIWNLRPGFTEPPDAIVFHFGAPGKGLFYLNEQILPEQVQSGGEYELVTQTPFTQLWVHHDRLGEPGTREKLAEYYRRTFTAVIRQLEPVVDIFRDDGIVITASPLGPGLKYLSMVGTVPASVQLVPAGQERLLAWRSKAEKVYTVGKPLAGYRSRPLAELELELEQAGGVVVFYENLRR